MPAVKLFCGNAMWHHLIIRKYRQIDIDIYGKYFNKLLIFCWTEWNARMEQTLGLTLSTGLCNQRLVNLHFNQNHVCWKAPYIAQINFSACMFRKVHNWFYYLSKQIISFFFFSFLIINISSFLVIVCLITFWKPFGIASVIIYWLSHGGGGGEVSLLLLGVSTAKKKWEVGSPQKWRVYQTLPSPPADK